MDIRNDEAYIGKRIRVRGKNYELAREVCLRGCKGCAFINRIGCEDDLTKYCRNGFIFQEIKK